MSIPAFLIANYLVRNNGRLAFAIDLIVSMPLALPPVAVGIHSPMAIRSHRTASAADRRACIHLVCDVNSRRHRLIPPSRTSLRRRACRSRPAPNLRSQKPWRKPNARNMGHHIATCKKRHRRRTSARISFDHSQSSEPPSYSQATSPVLHRDSPAPSFHASLPAIFQAHGLSPRYQSPSAASHWPYTTSSYHDNARD